MTVPTRVDYDELDFDYSAEGVQCRWPDQPFTGVGVGLYPDGTLRAESVFRNGLDTKAGSRWYASGQVQRRAVADEAQHTLHVTEWYDNGSPQSQTTYEFGVRTAEQRWDAQGTLPTDFRITGHDEYYETLLLYRAGNSTPA